MKSKILNFALIIMTAASCNTTKKTSELNDHSTSSIASKDSIILEKWTLIELEGQKTPRNDKNEVYFTLDPHGNRITGFAGCNSFFGNYNFEKNNRIHFSKLATTRMACPENVIEESEILKVFELTTNYKVVDDLLTLNVGRRSPLAIFKRSIPEVTEK